MLSKCLEGLKLAMLPYYPSYRHMATEDLDLVLYLGDYVYEAGSPPTAGTARPRPRWRCRHLPA